MSYSIFRVLQQEFQFDFKNFKYFAGHSLGEYIVLWYVPESLKFVDAVHLLSERGKAMQEAVPVGEGSMIAVLGSQISRINLLLNERKNNSGICEIANDNATGQIIMSGDKASVSQFQIILKEKKIKSIPLKVSAPLNSY